MDTKKDCKIPQCGPAPDLAKNKIVVGAKQLRKALRDGRARRVYLAENADPVITEPLAALCQQCLVPVSWVPDMGQLGKQCGIDVGAAAAAAVD